MRTLCVDFGQKRIGLAVGETEHKIARPLPNLSASGTLMTDAKNIHQVCQREQAETVVVGLPLDAQGETRASRICRKLGDCIASLGVPVQYVDEAMTSQDAEQDMVEIGLKGSERRKRSDAAAACRILERYFETIG